MSRRIYAIATMDTKGEEIAYVANCIRLAGAEVVTVDVGTLASPVCTPDIKRETVAGCHPLGVEILKATDRGAAVSAMAEALAAFLGREQSAGRVAGVIGLGGTGGTALITPAMRALPIGVAKVMVSTVAGGDVGAYVQGTDIVMVPSIVDVAGINRVSARILANASYAIAGMALGRPPQTAIKPCVGLTMFGVTTPCVSQVRSALEKDGYDCLVFHATGSGGRAMEKLVEAGMIEAVLDITTTEVADEVVGGVFPAGPARFDAIIKRWIPYVLSTGALDMVNFWAPETVPEKFKGRLFYRHNANVTLMRTTPEENREFARWIAGKLNRATAPFTFLIPEGGVSAIDAPGQPFHDPAADAALFEELERAIEPKPNRKIRRLPFHINDPAFADALVAAFREIAQAKNGRKK